MMQSFVRFGRVARGSGSLNAVRYKTTRTTIGATIDPKANQLNQFAKAKNEEEEKKEEPPRDDFFKSKLLPVVKFIAVINFGVLAYAYGQGATLSNPPEYLFPLSSTTKLADLDSPTYCSDDELKVAVEKIKQILGEENVKDSKVELEHHAKNDFTIHLPREGQTPKYIVYPESTQQVSEVMKVVFEHNVPVVPYSGGTSLEGHFYSTRPGVVVNMSKMNKIIEVHHEDLDAVVQGGVGWQQLNEHLAPTGLMLGCDCGPGAHIAGMINTNASGINAARYGPMKENVVSVTVVLCDGTVVKTKQRPRKSSAGYNLTGFFVGSEGTLGIITEATVKLVVKPKYETVIVAQFPAISNATATVAKILQTGIQVNAVELLDKDMMKCINYSGYSSRKWSEMPTLFFKVGDLNKVVVNEYVKEIQKISKENQCDSFLFAKDEKEQQELFDARKNAFYAMLDYGFNEIHETARLWVTDVAVPLSKLSPVLAEIEVMIKDYGLQSMILGHVGDSNFHADIFYKPEDYEKCKELVGKMIELGLKNEGTSTGEHGIGNGKRKYLEMELGPDAIDLMRKVKLALDPKRLLNPDKVFMIDPEDDGEY